MNIAMPILLSGTKNTRDLGGYPTADGHMTKYKRYFRSDGLHALTEEDKAILLEEYGVRCVIDLRSANEVQKSPYQFDGRMTMLNFPMIDQVMSSEFQGKMPPSMHEMYQGLLDHSGDTIKGVLHAMVEHSRYGGVLFHCTAGKDRTGVIAMLLLKLCGVDDETVIADYAATEGYMAELFEGIRKNFNSMNIDVPDYLLQSKPEEMRLTLAHLNGKYGGCEGYLKAIGMHKEEVAVLKRSVIGN
ncbi:tyrosine-protein phosphatase [Clostridia bacterium OttesenSCG-928-F22]|nr:tyrosine-protein phosphatase [Clostridia bacterium OttesenSCG-928-F22]